MRDNIAKILTAVEQKHNRDYLGAVSSEPTLDTYSTCLSTNISCDD